MENEKLVRMSDAISAILEEKISGKQLEIMRVLGTGMQAETLNQACDRHAQLIRDLPAVDAVEKRHGAWVWSDNSERVCVLCGGPVSFTRGKKGWIEGLFCQTCGARMDGEDGDA